VRRAGIIHNRPSIPSRALPIAAALAGVLAGASGWVHADGLISSPVFRVEASYTADSNVNRASADQALRDHALGVRASASSAIAVSTHTRAIVQGFAGTERFHTYTGLSRNFFGAQGDYQYRASGDFGTPTFGVFARTQADSYESNLRDGYRHAFGVNVLKPLTDRVQLFGALSRNITDGKSTVFDTRNTSLRGNADWSLSNWNVVYAGAEYRRGDIVSTAPLTPGRADIADAVTIIPDDAFHNPALFAYRFKASTWITTIGYNRAFSGGQSLDVSWRWVRSTPTQLRGLATAPENSYTANQLSLAYLVRF
jgi:hypothetical protein